MLEAIAAFLAGSAVTATAAYAYRQTLALRVLGSDLIKVRNAMRQATGNNTLKTPDAEKMIGVLRESGAQQTSAFLLERADEFRRARERIEGARQEIEDGARPMRGRFTL